MHYEIVAFTVKLNTLMLKIKDKNFNIYKQLCKSNLICDGGFIIQGVCCKKNKTNPTYI